MTAAHIWSAVKELIVKVMIIVWDKNSPVLDVTKFDAFLEFMPQTV